MRFATTALALALSLASGPLAAQDFDLRPRATPTPAPPPVVGPVDPENPTPTVRARPAPAPQPTASAPLVVPTFTPTPNDRASTGQAARPAPTRIAPSESGERSVDATPLPESARPASSVSAGAVPAPRPAADQYVPRRLDAVEAGGGGLIWALVGALLALLAIGAWLAWSRHFRLRAQTLPAPEVVRPHIAGRAPPASARLSDVAPAITLRLEATRMSATLINTTLSYRLAVTNSGAEALRDVVVAGDMIAAHASRPVEELLGPAGTALPELHRIAALAPGESVTLGGDIRLPLVAITPIRKGNAALFVPLARLRARAADPAGAAVEGGGTFLVGQPGTAGAAARLQPFRLDLGPRNYSRLGQQLLPATPAAA